VSFELTILGSSSALPTSKRFPTAQLLKVAERFFLIDCGEGTQVQLRRYGKSLGRIQHIFISHLHGDHVFGLFGLLSTLGMLGRKAPLHLYGPARLKEMLDQHFAFFVRPPFKLEYHSPDPHSGGLLMDDKRVEVLAIPLKHRIETYGYLFREKTPLRNILKERISELDIGLEDVVRIKAGADYQDAQGHWHSNEDLTMPPVKARSFAYISDTTYDPSLVERLTGVDLLFHEATFASKDEALARETMHSTAAQAARIALEAGVGKLLIGHFSNRYKDAAPLLKEARDVFSATEAANDGDVHSLPRTRG